MEYAAALAGLGVIPAVVNNWGAGLRREIGTGENEIKEMEEGVMLQKGDH